MSLKAKLFRLWWLPPLIVAAVWRLVVLASGAVSFHSDEAIVGLMARHINQGQPIPTFFYGQAYMGSLDPLLVSLMYRVTGETVIGIRLVQSILYLLFVATTMLLAFRLSGERRVAVIAGFLVALPSPAMTLYTTISLGGYGETLVIGNLLLLVGYDIGINRLNSWKHWLALGALAGLSWWTNSLIVVYILPVALLLLSQLRFWRPLRMIIIAFVAFLLFSGPWWLYNFSHNWESVRFLLGGFQGQHIGVTDKMVGFLFFGMPTIMGIRYSWTSSFWTGLWAVPVVILYLILLILSLLRKPRIPAIYFLWAMVIGYIAVFVLSSFGVDATGRYLLPLTVPLVILLAIEIDGLSNRYPLALSAIAIILGVNVIGTALAMRNVPPGLTPQFDPATDFSNDYDQQVISFLREHGGQYGYGTYWVAYRLIFLSHETVILSPQLPYKTTLVYTGQDRYPAYTGVVDQAYRPVFVTANLPQLDTIIEDRLKTRAVTFSQQVIGPFTIFYDLSAHVTPAELGLQNLTGTESPK